MTTIWHTFDGAVRAIVPLFETEIRGLPMLERLGQAMFPEVADRIEPELHPS
jgi:hypothetical protein